MSRYLRRTRPPPSTQNSSCQPPVASSFKEVPHDGTILQGLGCLAEGDGLGDHHLPRDCQVSKRRIVWTYVAGAAMAIRDSQQYPGGPRAALGAGTRTLLRPD